MRQLLLICLITSSYLLMTGQVFAQNVITLDPQTTFQTISGWEAVQFADQENPNYSQFRDDLMDKVVNELGITRVRLELYRGSEQAVDYYSQYLNGDIQYDLRDANNNRICPSDKTPYWRYVRYTALNDNNNPFLLEPDPTAPTDTSRFKGFQFSHLDHTIDNVILPLRQKMAQSGGQLKINLNYVAFVAQVCSIYNSTPNPLNDPLLHRNTSGDPDFEEYAELIEATFLHMDRKYGFVPDYVELVLEPDNTAWTGQDLGNALTSVVNRLQVRGFTPRIIAPSVTNIDNTDNFFDLMVQSAGATAIQNYLEEISYHRYQGTDASLPPITSRAAQYGVNASMLEWWSNGNNYASLHKDLKIGLNSAYEEAALMGLYSLSTPTTVTLANKTKYMRQYYRYIRPGAQRISATTSGCTNTQLCTNLDPLAFIHPDGRYVVVVKTGSAQSFQINNLPAGTYGLNYSSGTDPLSPAQSNINLSDINLTAGQSLSTSIPGPGVISIYQKYAPPTGGPPVPGDYDADGDVDFTDLRILITNFGSHTIFTFNALIQLL